MATTTAPDVLADTDRTVSRQERLAAAVRALRTRSGSADPARIMLIVGSILVPLGGVLIILGWWGASHTVWVYEQIPYAISGGLLGLGLVFAGAFCYFGYWLSQVIYAVRRDAEQTRDALGRIEALLAGGPAVAAAPAVAAPGAASTVAAPGAVPVAVADARPAGAVFFATANGTVFHRGDCPAVTGRDGVRPVSADDGLSPCRICEPLADQ